MQACWSADGSQIYAGRRNGTVDVWDVRLVGRSGPSNTPRLLKTLRNPASSGVVSCVVAFPDCRHLVWLVFQLLCLASISGWYLPSFVKTWPLIPCHNETLELLLVVIIAHSCDVSTALHLITYGFGTLRRRRSLNLVGLEVGYNSRSSLGTMEDMFPRCVCFSSMCLCGWFHSCYSC